MSDAHTTPVPAPTLEGSTISHYTVLDRIGSGGMGVVYKALDVRLERIVALKFLPPDLTQDPVARERFLREARAASALDHPRVCAIHEVDTTADGQVFICMAHYAGETLKQKIARGPLGVSDALGIAAQVADGLAAAHQHGIIHRDIKPANLMITGDGEVKILDFGLAVLAGHSSLTRTGRIAGTVAYMSPEQAAGHAADPRSDVWSLGVVLFEMLTGRLPFPGDSDRVVLNAIQHQSCPSLSSLRGGVPEDAIAVVRRCLDKDPARRFGSAVDLRSSLGRARHRLASTDAPTRSIDDSSTMAPAKLRRRPVLYVTAAAILVLALVTILIGRRYWGSPGAETALPEQLHAVVLPFANLSGDRSSRMFCDGLVETLTSALSQIESLQGSLWVVPMNEIRSRGVESPSEAWRIFGANLAVTGAIQREGDLIRLTLNLVDTKSVRQLRSQVIDARLSDPARVQDDVVEALTTMLDLQLHPQDRRALSEGGTRVPAAYDLYLQACGVLQGSPNPANLETAADLFSQAVKLDPTFALAWAGLGDTHLRRYNLSKDVRWFDEATQCCHQAMSIEPRLPTVQITLGLLDSARGRFDQAVKEFASGIALQPRNSAAIVGLARAHEALGQLELSEATFRRGIDVKPDYWPGYNSLGAFYMRHGRYADAETQFRKVLSLTPENYWGFNNLGGLYIQLARDREAEELFRKSLAVQPSYYACSNLGTLYYREHRYRDAAEMYERALALDSQDYRVWGNLGHAYEMLPGMGSKATDAFRRAQQGAEEQRRVKPKDPILLVNLAGFSTNLGDKQAARDLLEQAVGQKPDDVDLIFEIGHTYEELGDRERALAWIGRALDQGYSVSDAQTDPGLAALRTDPRFQQILQTSRNMTKHQEVKTNGH